MRSDSLVCVDSARTALSESGKFPSEGEQARVKSSKEKLKGDSKNKSDPAQIGIDVTSHDPSSKKNG
ncbi:MAG: hypothetical protein CL930_09690 [Deltaproteobacteria bacterium]|nr:hypothetical protein [Deltaproteobacteria bacterium]|tara:strand:- start:872 stop:1072 length:201 start_codon:yes stop_codon:yes gene_type:complete